MKNKILKSVTASLILAGTVTPAMAQSATVGQYVQLLDDIMKADKLSDIPDREPKPAPEPKVKEPKEPKAPRCKDLFD